MPIVLLADLGDGELARGALQQPNTKALFQLDDAPAEFRFGHAERAARARVDNPTADEKDLARVTLLPARSARALLDVATACDECRLDHEVDIGPDAIQAAIELCDAFGPYLPVLCPEVTSFDGSSDNPARKLADRLRLESKLNASMEQLLERGIGVFVGSYVDFIQRPRYDIDEGCWSTRINQKYEDVKIGIVRLGPASSSQLIARVKTEPIPF